TLGSRRPARATAADHRDLPPVRQGSRGRAPAHGCAWRRACRASNSRRRQRSLFYARRHTTTPSPEESRKSRRPVTRKLEPPRRQDGASIMKSACTLVALLLIPLAVGASETA